MNDYNELIEEIRITGMTEGHCEILLNAADAIEQLVKERDAAIEDIPKCCAYCGKQLECEKPCVYDDSKCEEFEWRGVKEDNDE